MTENIYTRIYPVSAIFNTTSVILKVIKLMINWKKLHLFLSIFVKNQIQIYFSSMALFKLDWAFPTQESSFAGGEKFLEYLEAGGPADEEIEF